VDITVEDDFLGLFDPKTSYKHVSDFEQLQSYDCFRLRIKVKNYCKDIEKTINRHIT